MNEDIIQNRNKRLDIIATIMIQQSCCYYTALALLIEYEESTRKFYNVNAEVEKIIKSALEQIKNLSGYTKAPTTGAFLGF